MNVYARRGGDRYCGIATWSISVTETEDWAYRLSMGFARAALAMGATLLPMAGHAGGWACAEGSLVQKYRLAAGFLVAEDDPWSKLMERDAKSLGVPYEPERWQIVVNNDKGVVAVSAGAGVDGSQHQYVSSNTLLITSYGGFRHVIVEVNGKITDTSGSCVSY